MAVFGVIFFAFGFVAAKLIKTCCKLKAVYSTEVFKSLSAESTAKSRPALAIFLLTSLPREFERVNC